MDWRWGGEGEACRSKSLLNRKMTSASQIHNPAVINQLYLWPSNSFSTSVILTKFHGVSQNTVEPHSSKELPIWKWLYWNKNKNVTKTIFYLVSLFVQVNQRHISLSFHEISLRYAMILLVICYILLRLHPSSNSLHNVFNRVNCSLWVRKIRMY